MATIRKKRQSTLRQFDVGVGLPSPTLLAVELQDMTDVLLGRKNPPVFAGNVEALLEVADAYFARASEIAMKILAAEREGKINKSSPYSKFRTGELRIFMDLARSAASTGSRRITVTQMQENRERTGRESA